MIVTSRGAPNTRTIPAQTANSPLTGGARVEVCIVGAGLPGMIAAYLLAREKHAVMVLDEGPIAAPLPGAEAAQLAGIPQRPFAELTRRYGVKGARIAAQSFAAAIDGIEAIVRRERIACDFERLDGYALACAGASCEPLEREVEAARTAGVEDVELLYAAPVEGGGALPAIRYPSQALFHPQKFVAGLARAIARDGGRIHCGVRTRPAPGGRGVLVTAAGHRIEAEVVVTAVASSAGGTRRAHGLGLRVPRGAVAHAIYWDHDAAPVTAHLRASGSRAGEVLMVGGPATRENAQEEQRALEAWARERFGCAAEVVQRFTREVVGPAEMFAFAGRDDCDSESVYVSDATWGTAMTRAAIAGMVIKDFVQGARAPWAELYMPSACYTGADSPYTPAA